MSLYYKVLRVGNDGLLHSFYSLPDNQNTPLDMIYTPGVWTSADCMLGPRYGLTVFDTLYNLNHFANWQGDFVIEKWVCECKHHLSLPERLNLAYLYNLDEISNVIVYNPSVNTWPKGTLMFEHVRLIRRLG